MATIDFPSYLPAGTISRDQYEFQHTSPFARTTMATGRARQRRTFQYVPSSVPITWRFTEPQAQLFEAWFKYDITDGADWFNANLKTPIGNIAPYECRFSDMYSGPSLDNSDYWIFTASLEIRERPVLSETDYLYGQQFLLQSDIIDIALNSKWPSA